MFSICPQVASLIYGDEANAALYLAVLPDGVPVVVNQPGPAIWQGLTDGLTESEIARELAEVYGEDESSIRADVHSFLTHLAEQGFICQENQ